MTHSFPTRRVSDIIKKRLTGNTVGASDKRARFVGLAAYEEAGGVILRDLFSRDHEGWLEDVALLERLVVEKLTSESEAIKAEGWNWVQIAQDRKSTRLNSSH